MTGRGIFHLQIEKGNIAIGIVGESWSDHGIYFEESHQKCSHIWMNGYQKVNQPQRHGFNDYKKEYKEYFIKLGQTAVAEVELKRMTLTVTNELNRKLIVSLEYIDKNNRIRIAFGLTNAPTQVTIIDQWWKKIDSW